MLLASDMTGEGGTAELLDFGVCRPRSDTLGEAASMRSLARRSISFRLLVPCVRRRRGVWAAVAQRDPEGEVGRAAAPPLHSRTPPHCGSLWARSVGWDPPCDDERINERRGHSQPDRVLAVQARSQPRFARGGEPRDRGALSHLAVATRTHPERARVLSTRPVLCQQPRCSTLLRSSAW